MCYLNEKTFRPKKKKQKKKDHREVELYSELWVHSLLFLVECLISLSSFSENKDNKQETRRPIKNKKG